MQSVQKIFTYRNLVNQKNKKNIQTYKYAGIKTYKHGNTKRTNIQTHKNTNTKHTNIQNKNIQTYKHTHTNCK